MLAAVGEPAPDATLLLVGGGAARRELRIVFRGRAPPIDAARMERVPKVVRRMSRIAPSSRLGRLDCPALPKADDQA